MVAAVHAERRAGADRTTGRRAGWAGLANLFYWVDRSNGIGGFWATQILPFGDPTSFSEYLAFESAAYESLAGSAAA